MDNRDSAIIRCQMPVTDTTRIYAPHGVLAASWMLAALYAAIALAAMWLAPRVPYADGWRFLGHFASVPVLQAIFAPDNGHHEILPNAVRVLELRAFAANQSLQVWTSIGLLLATLACVWMELRKDPVSARRAAAMLAAVLGFCWLGNIRALGHASESVHAYLVTLCVVLGIAVLACRDDAQPDMGAAARAALLGAVAAFSFGSGIAAFAAFFVVAWLRGARPSAYLMLGAAMLATLVLRRWSNAGAEATMLQFAPLAQLDLWLRWLSGPSVYAIWPAADPALAAHVPTAALRALAEAMARAWSAAFGPVMLARWPHLLVGAFGVCWLAIATWRAREQASRPMLLGIGLAWFAFAVGGLIAVVRLRYFGSHPGQLLAPRYVVWSSLFWAGLAIATIAAAPRPRVALLCTLAVAFGLLPSQFWMWRLGESLRHTADRTAVAAAVGVLDPALATGETVPDELARALPVIRKKGAAVYAWPETALLGQPLRGGVQRAVPTTTLSVVPVPNRLGAPGRRARFAAETDATRLLLVDADGIVRGIAIRDPDAGGWLGWMRGPDRGAVRAVELR